MDSLTKGIGELLIDPKYTDLEIQCGGKCYLVHRAIVCKRSKVIERECDGNFKEARTRVIEHEVYGFRAIDRMLQFMYGGDYKLDPCTPWKSIIDADSTPMRTDLRDEKEEPLIAHIRVYGIADYYEVPELKKLAREKFTAEKDTREALTMDKILAVAKAMYESTSVEAEELRAQMMDLCHRNAKVTVEDKVFASTITRRGDLQEFRGDFMNWRVERLMQQQQDDAASYQTAVKLITDDLDTAKSDHYARLATVRQEKCDLEAAYNKKQADAEAAHAKEKAELQAQITQEKEHADAEFNSFQREHQSFKGELKLRIETQKERDAAKIQLARSGKLPKKCPKCEIDFETSPQALEFKYRWIENAGEIADMAQCNACSFLMGR